MTAATAPQLIDSVSGAVIPLRPSRALQAFGAERQRQRQQAAAAAESAALAATGYRPGLARRPRSATALDTTPESAFPVVSGQRSFGAGSVDRLTADWTALNTGINADLERALMTLRARSRDWCMNTPNGQRFMQLCQDNILGAEGPLLRVRALTYPGSNKYDTVANGAIEDAWSRWCERGTCEVTERLSFNEASRIALGATVRDGEGLARRVRDSALDYGFRLQLLDVDRINSQQNLAPTALGTPAIRLGIEIDTVGKATGMWLYNRHPGDAGAGYAPRQISNRVDARDVFHAFRTHRPEQVRGYPWAAAALRKANILDKFEEYALVAARWGAANMGFYTVDKDAVENALSLEALKQATGQLVQDVEAGMLEALPPGVNFQAFDPKYPEANFGPFVTANMRDQSAGLGVAHHNLSGDMTGVNYSSARIAELTERRRWRADQIWFIGEWYRRVFADWLRMALLTGSIKLPNGSALPADAFGKFYAAAKFQPSGWSWVDPQADVQAAATAMAYDMRSLRQITDENAVDLDEVLSDKQHLLEKYALLNLPVPSWIAGVPPPADPVAPAAPTNPKPGAAAA